MKTPTENVALAIDLSHNISIQRSLPLPVPAEDEILVQVLYSGINPADVKHKGLGIVDTHLGYDFCGRILEIPAGSSYQKGDIIAGYGPTGVGRPKKYGAHQNVLACLPEMIFSVPDTLPQAHAAALCVTTATGADIVFNIFNFPLLSDSAKLANHEGLLVWGASSSVGCAAIQFAKAAGQKYIFATASRKQHEILTELGATHCFDYKDADVIRQITATAESLNITIHYGIDAVGTSGLLTNSATLLRQCCAQDARLASTIYRSSGFAMPFATKNTDVNLSISMLPPLETGSPTIKKTISANREEHFKAWKGVLWAAEHYSDGFVLPKVQEIGGDAEEVLRKLEEVADGRGGFGKWVVRHPLT